MRVRCGMVADLMAVFRYLLDPVRVCFYPYAGNEKGCFEIISFKDLQNFRGTFRPPQLASKEMAIFFSGVST